MVKGHVGACSSRQVRAHHFWTLQYTVVANSCLALEIVKTPSFACLWKNNVLKCMVCEITYFSTTVIRLHLLLNCLIRAVGYEESRNGTGPENLTTEEIFSCDHSQARKAHESFTLSLTHGIWQPYLDMLTDILRSHSQVQVQLNHCFLRTFLKSSKKLRSFESMAILATPSVHERLKTDLTSNLGPQWKIPPALPWISIEGQYLGWVVPPQPHQISQRCPEEKVWSNLCPGVTQKLTCDFSISILK